ncbi:MAG: hypothetical protein F6K00_18650 [Leptolyngbya sp. SIOISBB]|nr:hypothetical protein [Leptolyngbya sp. SIOISBB]
MPLSPVLMLSGLSPSGTSAHDPKEPSVILFASLELAMPLGYTVTPSQTGFDVSVILQTGVASPSLLGQ